MLASKIRYITWVHLWGTNGAGAAENHHLCALSSKNFGLGQRLVVTSGCGWVQCQGGAKREIRAGDVVACPPGEKHWHGATATTGISHIAIQEALNGIVVEWLEKVTDEEYL